MKTFLKRTIIMPLIVAICAPLVAVSVASAASTERSTNDTSTSPTTNSSTATSGETALATFKTKGDAEISRRLKTLDTLTTKISANTKLSASDKTALTAEVTSEISGLTALKTKLDAETTRAGAIADVQSMISDYRVYALIVPKVELLKTADSQQQTQDKLTTLAAKLQTRITEAKTAGKDVTALQTQLDQMKAQISAAQALSTAEQTKLLALQPTDYDADHTVLLAIITQLKSAQSMNQTAYNSAKSIVAGLKAL
ncbi:MAG TPA: hypothetical protein VJP80_05980 [Candidatus Saccharimonadales bacterium]|nr:hypothetical protein [Candidatus Saccharimonadales bacterium]